ncbi:MAG: hypothetical protein JRN52_00205 [Nitrososphaerota archaeon]|nr:hypothetical protein [Nitrososphaerota archaeon]
MADGGDAKIVTKIKAITAQKTDDRATRSTPVVFNFGVNMDEASRESDSVTLDFHMSMDTEPAIAKFIIDGSTTVQGDPSAIEKMMASDPQTEVPAVFTQIYQEIYSVLFLLAGQIDVPYPSPALLKKPQVRAAYQNQISN